VLGEKSVGKAKYTKRFESFHDKLGLTVLGVDPQQDKWDRCKEHSEKICGYHLKFLAWHVSTVAGFGVVNGFLLLSHI
jgi:hypothetical protein